MDKQKLRKKVYALRKNTSDRQIREDSSRITARILENEEYRNADALFAYVDYRHEVMTRPLIVQAWKDGKRVAVPRVTGDEMHFYYLESFDQLEPGCMGIPEPAGCRSADEDDHALVIVPGVAFDEKRHRIGYGGGYYDKYLSRHPDHPTMAAAFEFQIFDEVPAEDTDILPDQIVTESRTLK